MKQHYAVVGASFAEEHTEEESATMEGASTGGLCAAKQVVVRINEQRI
jgi:hypothetical protein